MTRVSRTEHWPLEPPPYQQFSFAPLSLRIHIKKDDRIITYHSLLHQENTLYVHECNVTMKNKSLLLLFLPVSKGETELIKKNTIPLKIILLQQNKAHYKFKVNEYI